MPDITITLSEQFVNDMRRIAVNARVSQGLVRVRMSLATANEVCNDLGLAATTLESLLWYIDEQQKEQPQEKPGPRLMWKEIKIIRAEIAPQEGNK